ncbi:MAG: hypothetical protein QNL88_12900 [Acidobacteriota bacterium]|nr:hypothetical protein [Acidobacteriota bacterium]
MAPDDAPELGFYRAVEDLFSTFRGVPHVLSPKDFQLLRSWWREQIPLTAVRTGVAEVFARRRERGDAEPVVSLSYCRHAVEAHAKRVAEMRIGSTEASGDAPTITPESVRGLAETLRSSANRIRAKRPRVAAVMDRISCEVGEAAGVDSHFVEEHLYALETSLLVDCFDALEDEDRLQLEARARADAERAAATPEARERTFRALRDRLLRDLIQLPRLEIES